LGASIDIGDSDVLTIKRNSSLSILLLFGDARGFVIPIDFSSPKQQSSSCCLYSISGHDHLLESSFSYHHSVPPHSFIGVPTSDSSSTPTSRLLWYTFGGLGLTLIYCTNRFTAQEEEVARTDDCDRCYRYALLLHKVIR